MTSHFPEIAPYFPHFVWKFWLSETDHISHVFRDPRVHIYDVYNNDLSETRRIPVQTRGVFHDFRINIVNSGFEDALEVAEAAFVRLEVETEAAIAELVGRVSTNGNDGKVRMPVDSQAINAIRRYFAFLRFRNSNKYAEIVAYLREPDQSPDISSPQAIMFPIRCRVVLGGLLAYLQPKNHATARNPVSHPLFDVILRSCQETVQQYCWRFSGAEVCIGIATGNQEFMLTDTCFGTLDEGFIEDPECHHIFFPIMPSVALYLLADDSVINACNFESTRITPSRGCDTTWIDCGYESPSDVHLRNAMLLQTYPRLFYFSSLRSVALSVSSYDEFRWIPEHLDYSRMKQRCRQKFTQEDVTKTLVVKGSVILTDLTDQVTRLGKSAVAHGSFSDVWKGIWINPVDNQPKTVALKVLRQVLVQNVREKLLKRLKDEVVAWHRLQHPHIAHLYGVVQHAQTLGMVSPWCEHGTIAHYLKHNPAVNRLDLLIQIASGVSYLHNFKPVVVHGDLKGGNILIDDEGKAIITDFGLSKVMEDISETINLATSFFAGSTRWMAPELVLALVEDNGRAPQITTYSDVYSFASVCLEIITGEVPYPHRSNDHAVTVDIMRGVKPSRGASCRSGEQQEALWGLLDRCWDEIPRLRPSMCEITTVLGTIVK